MTPRATTGAFSQAGERATDDEHHDPSPHRRRASTAGTGSSSLAAFAQRIALPGCVIVPASRTSSPTRPFAAASNASSASPPPRSKPSSKKNAVQPWSREDVMTLPNYISMARGAFGPVLGAAYVADAVVPEAMLAGVAVAGLSDWLDGYAARRMRLTSVAGTYLDPLGDKIFVASVAVALAAKGGIPLWLATSMVARDVALISGAWIQRGRALGWRWDSWGQFFAGTRGARFEDAATLGGVDFKKKIVPRPPFRRCAPMSWGSSRPRRSSRCSAAPSHTDLSACRPRRPCSSCTSPRAPPRSRRGRRTFSGETPFGETPPTETNDERREGPTRLPWFKIHFF